MNLDDLLGEEDIESIAGKPFSIGEIRNAEGVNEIHPEIPYERRDFVKKAKALSKLQKYYRKYGENGDKTALKDMIDLLLGYIEGDKKYKRDWFESAHENPHIASSRAENYLEVGEEAMARFVENHRRELLDKLSEKSLAGLISNPNLGFYKTGDKKWDRITELRNKYMQIQKAMQEKGDLASIVGEELEQLIKRMPIENSAYVSEYEHVAVPGMADVLLRLVVKKYSSLFKGKDGKLDKSEIIKYLEANYKLAEDYAEDIPKSETGELKDNWDNRKAHYLAVANSLYRQEEPEQDKEDNPDQLIRQEKARDAGLNA